MRILIIGIVTFLFPNQIFAQGCCSGGSGSPIAGGTSQGVLAERQAEIGMSWQSINTDKFLTGDKPAFNFLKDYYSNYLYSRFAYGVTKNFTMSIEAGYFFNKTQIGLGDVKVSDKGISDLIIFPRYKIYEHNTEKTRDEITLGIGLKIPLGKYLDSTVSSVNPFNGEKNYIKMPPVVMPTTGANDFIFYGFAYRGYPEKKFRIFANAIYIRKGWNALGERFGDYASVGLFAGKTFFKNLGVTLQLKGEWIDKMDYDKQIDMLAIYNIDVNSFGSKKIAIVPQISYPYKSFSVYILSEFPLYQYVNGTAIASQYLFTLGVSYRFFTVKQNG
ncbi:MAG: hypothetical protein ACHQII_05925 [Bacteroidia bacterium]